MIGATLTVLLVASMALPTLTPAAHAATITVTNGNFSSGTAGWQVTKPSVALKAVDGGESGKSARLVTSASNSTVTVQQTSPAVSESATDGSYRVSGWLKSSDRDRTVTLGVRESRGSQSRVVESRAVAQRRDWTQVSVSFTPRWEGSTLRIVASGVGMSQRDTLRVDSVTMTGPAASTGGGSEQQCAVSRRGIPSCGAYMGASVGLNDDPTTFERQVGGKLAVHRLFYRGDQVSKAVSEARRDLANGRVPWISFTFPHSWRDMANGRGDAWARDVARRFASLDGPVWVAFHHEPEKDGDIALWRRAQERLAPIVRSNASNVAYTVILMGYHQLYGDTNKYGFDKAWPNTKVDLLGVDTYNFYGAPGKSRSSSANLVTQYFEPIGRWARNNNVAWGVGETGYTDRALAEDPNWLRNTFRGLKANGGVAMSYFNSAPSSASGDWLLDTSHRRRAFADALSETTRIP